MSEIHEIKHRLSAVRQTRQITNAMYMISSTRMKKEAMRAEYARRYIYQIRATVKDIIEKSSYISHPYLQKKSGNRAAFLVIAGDKGLCGSYNSAVLKYAAELIKLHDTRYVETVGRIATEYFARRGMMPDAENLRVAQNPRLHNAREIAENLLRLYTSGKTDEVYIVFTRFIDVTQSYPYCIRLLPLSLDAYEDVKLDTSYTADMLYEPSPREVFNNLVPQLAVGIVFAALVQSTASEHCARMNAMQNATRNADEMIEKLSHQYNTQRQISITNEIIEITSGSMGIEKYKNKK